jgi:hypothetical protein
LMRAKRWRCCGRENPYEGRRSHQEPSTEPV